MFVIQKDTTPPKFLVARGQWDILDKALHFMDEATAQNVIDANDLRDVVVLPLDEPV